MSPTEPTYRTEGSTYICLYCEEQGLEHRATDKELFQLHMQQRHDGRMLSVEQAPQGTEAAAQAAQASPAPPPQESGDY